MIKAGRAQRVVEHQTVSGVPVRLVEQTWWSAVGGSRWGVAFGYRHPLLVETGGAQKRLTDHLGILRLVALLAILGARIVRRSSS